LGEINSLIEGLFITPLKIIRDERGAVMHMLRSDSPHFKTFGEIYFSVVNPGVTKGWKRHKQMEQNFAVPQGNMKFVFIDHRENSSTKNAKLEIVIGSENYQLISVPPMIWYSFACVGNQSAMITNCASIPHDPNESETLPLDRLT
jgi:dTDP-4-dehydrorhamnose 3,5-epimerase